MEYVLPRKVPNYIARLHQQYQRNGDAVERNLLANARATVVEHTDEGWNNEIGHDVWMFLSLDDLERVGIDEQANLAQSICTDLNKLGSSISGEYFNVVHIELEDEADELFQRSIPFGSRRPPDADDLAIWKPGLVRLFISHRDQHKAAANTLSLALEKYGVSCFVAHDNIEANAEWREEILKGLDTMELMLVFLTNDFQESVWTNQEVGFALGKDIPVISLKLEQTDPPGFISNKQAMRGSLYEPQQKLDELYALIAKELGRVERLNSGLVSAFVSSQNFVGAIDRFQRMEKSVDKLTDQQVEQIIEGFRDNDQLHKCGYFTQKRQRLCQFLKKVSGNEYEQIGHEISPVVAAAATYAIDEEIPF